MLANRIRGNLAWYLDKPNSFMTRNNNNNNKKQNKTKNNNNNLSLNNKIGEGYNQTN